MRPLLPPGAVEDARSRIAPHLLPTPLLEAPDLSERLGCRVRLKPESLQATGSFKVRGAASMLLSLSPAERGRGVVACSSGNHGRAVAHVARRLGVPATVFVPSWVDSAKAAAIAACGARIVQEGGSYDEAEDAALALARDEGLSFVSPFDDPRVAAGQGTIALEILEEAPDVSAVVVPLSGGGLAGGIAAGLREAGSDARVLAVSATRARVMLETVRAGRPIEMAEEETWAEALAGGVGRPNRHTVELVRRGVHRHATVDEAEIVRAMAHAFRTLRLVVEGGGAVALARLLSKEGPRDLEGIPPGAVVCLLSGGNVAPGRLARALREAEAYGPTGGDPEGGARGTSAAPEASSNGAGRER